MAKISVFVGSIRDGRAGRKVADWVVRGLRKRQHDVHLIDPLEHDDLLLLDHMYKSVENPSEDFQALQRTVAESDGYVAVTPEYNHSFSGTIKNAIDAFLEEYTFKCFGIVTYSASNFGGIHAASALRSVTAELGAPAIPTSLAVSKVSDVFDDEGNLLEEAYEKRLAKFLDELEWFADALASKRSQGTPY